MPGYERGFESLRSERSGVDLAVEGDLPDWLDGTLIRNGPAEFERGAAHWFDGLAMLHRLGFDGAADRVSYTNRFLRSEAHEAARDGGRAGGQFATGVDGGLLARLRALLSEPTDNANVHVARLGGRYLALTETPRAVAFDPDTLETTGHPEFSGATVHHVVAHLRRDRAAGETWGVGVAFGLRHRYRVFRIPDGSLDREAVASIRVDRPAYLHSLALTPNYAVLVEPPYTVRPRDFLLSGGGFIDNYEWDPDRGTRFLLVDRDTGAVTERRGEAVFAFHTANAFETGDEVVVDLVGYDDAAIVEDLFLDAVDSHPRPTRGELRRYRLDLPADAGGVTAETLYADGTELPRFSPAVAGQSYDYVYGQATGREGMNGLVKIDVTRGLNQEWWEPDLWAEEPVFVPEPGADREDAGVVLALALDAAPGRTLLLVLDGTTFTERARVELPHVVPFGFHGRYFPEL